MSRVQDKAQILVAAWQSLFGAPPPYGSMVNAMAVAELETRMGDAWPGENNWGAVMKRQLSATEAATLKEAGIVASGGATALAEARKLLTPGTNEALHIDTTPGHGTTPGQKFFAWFWNFPTAVEAARKFLEVLVGPRAPKTRAIIEHATPEELATAMYEVHFYEGFHKDDPAANIRDYANGIRRNRAAIEKALGAAPAPSSPPAVSPAPPASVPPSASSPSRAGVAGVVAVAVIGVLMLAKRRHAA